jgi:putative pyruvate formate lyase activating enzyme
MKPGYLKLFSSGELKERSEIFNQILNSCELCPHKCKTDRYNFNTGRCRSGKNPVVASYCVHHGEEPALQGEKGVGNIFFANCNLKCCYCQNYQISQGKSTDFEATSIEHLAEIMLDLQNKDVTSIGLVSGVHFLPQIISALLLAIPKGLNLPLIYNTNGYDSLQTIKLLDGIIDIYLPDYKYGEDEFALKYSKIENYTEITSAAINEMVKQVRTELIYDSAGNLIKGIIIRHLVLPNDIAESENVFKEIKRIAGTNITLSIMSQYYPTYKAHETELLDRDIRESEYTRVLNLMEKYGFENGWIQEFNSKDNYQPDFSNQERPFQILNH